MNDEARSHLELIRAQSGGVLRPADVLNDARNPNSPLHPMFTWDDSEAAEAFRMIQARKVIRAVIRVVHTPDREPVRVRAYTASPPDNDNANAFRASVTLLADPRNEAEAYRALAREVEQLRLKYATFPALEKMVAAFKAVLDKRLPTKGLSNADTLPVPLSAADRKAGTPGPSNAVFGGKRESGGSLRRFKINPGAVRHDRAAAALAPDHPAMLRKRSLFSSQVTDAEIDGTILTPGHNNAKTGGMVMKGPWRGMPIYTLSWEERATCPESCHLWAECYGNAMPFAKRNKYGARAMERLGYELRELARDNPAGFVVRLHVLGDFPDAAYVRQWGDWIESIPQIHVFGYTAHDLGSDIGGLIADLNIDHQSRWQVRYSVPPDDSPQWMQATTVWRSDRGKVPEGVVCPASSGDTEACGTCGLCWNPNAFEARIVFLGHGMNRGERKPAEYSVARQILADDAKDIGTAPVPVEDAIAWGRHNKVGSGNLADINAARERAALPPFRVIKTNAPADPLPAPHVGGE